MTGRACASSPLMFFGDSFASTDVTIRGAFRLPTVVHMDVLDPDKLLPAATQSANDLGSISPEDLSAPSNASFAKRRLKGRARTPDTGRSATGRKEVGNDDT